MSRPRLLDLFSGAGGAAMGYHRAGFDVVGVDIEPQANYPFEFHQADALLILRDLVAGRLWSRCDVIHASPPCKASSSMRHMWNARQHNDLIAPTRELLERTGLPYVIENVEGAALRNPIRLCGSSFGLGAAGRQLRRHRLFECSFPVMSRPCQHRGDVIGVYGTGGGGQMTRGFKARGAREAGEALGIDWMRSLDELSQAIPPAYTEYVGGYLMAELQAKAAA